MRIVFFAYTFQLSCLLASQDLPPTASMTNAISRVIDQNGGTLASAVRACSDPIRQAAISSFVINFTETPPVATVLARLRLCVLAFLLHLILMQSINDSMPGRREFLEAMERGHRIRYPSIPISEGPSTAHFSWRTESQTLLGAMRFTEKLSDEHRRSLAAVQEQRVLFCFQELSGSIQAPRLTPSFVGNAQIIVTTCEKDTARLVQAVSSVVNSGRPLSSVTLDRSRVSLMEIWECDRFNQYCIDLASNLKEEERIRALTSASGGFGRILLIGRNKVRTCVRSCAIH